MNQNYNRIYSKAAGCFLGQLAGDALGSAVEFLKPTDIYQKYPNGVRALTGFGLFNTIPGQPSDDSEMAILLARSIIEHKKYDLQKAMEAYK